MGNYGAVISWMPPNIRGNESFKEYGYRMWLDNNDLEEKLDSANKVIAQMKADSNDLIESNLDNLDLFNDNSTN